MALTIAYDGYGVIANADADTNDTGGTATGDWSELGGGTIGTSPDTYLYSGASPDPLSLGSKYATKSGYSYFDGGKSLGYNSGGAEEGEMLWMWVFIAAAGAFKTLANHGFNAVAGNTVATGRAGDNYQWRIAGSDDANGWSGGWKAFALDPSATGDSVGTPSLTGLDTFGVWIDTAVSVRADSIFQSQMFSAKGLIVTGTPTANAWDEIATWCTDYVNRAAPMVQVRGSTYFCIGTFTVGDGSTTTVLEASGSKIEFEACEYWNGTSWVTTMSSTVNNIVTTVAASIDWLNTSVEGVPDNKLNLDISLGNASSVVGGTLKLLRALSVKSSDIFRSVIFNNNDALSAGSATYDSCGFVECGTFTVTSSVTLFSGNTISPATGVTGVQCDTKADVEELDGVRFISGGTGHGLQIGDGTTVLTTQSITLTDLEFDSYDVANPGTVANKAIYVNSGSGGGTITLNISGGSGVSQNYHVRATNCTVVVVSSVPVSVTVTAEGVAVEGAAIYLKTSGGTVVLNGLTNSSGVLSGSYGGTTPATIDTDVSGVKHASSTIPYEYFTLGGSITGSGYSQTALLSED